MEDIQKHLGNIIKHLRNNPRGMSVSDLSRAIKLNRNSTAKYLDILLYTGRVDVRSIGRAKMYYISHRIPISALLEFSSDQIIGLDDKLRIIEVNDNFLRFFKVKKDMLIEKRITSTDVPIFSEPRIVDFLQKAVKGTQSNIEIEHMIGNEKHFFRSKLIPTILADGRKGVTIILENVDEQKVAQKLMKDSEEKFRAIYQAARDAMIITDSDTIFECNQATMEMFGCDDVEFLMRKFHFFSPPVQPSGEDSQALYARHQKEAREKGLARFDWVHRRFDGSDFQADTIISPFELYGKQALLLVIRDISERKEFETALRDNEEKYRILFESSPDAIFLIEDGKIIQCNRSTMEIFGFDSIDQVIGKHPADLSPPFQPGGEVSRTMANRILKEVYEKGEMKFSWEHIRKGNPFSADVSLAITKLNDRFVIQTTIRDVTKIKKIQEDLSYNESRLRNILSSLHGAFIGMIDRNYHYSNFWGSKELDELYGMDSKKIPGSSIFSFAPPGHEDELRNILDRVFDTGVPVTIEVEVELPSGLFNQSMSFSPYRGEDGKIDAIVQFATDTTEKFRAFEKLQHTEKLYKLLDDNVDDVIWMTDNKLNFTYMSSSSQGLTGFPVEDLIGKNITTLVQEDPMGMMEERLGNVFSDLLDGKPGNYPPKKMELELRKKDGSGVWTEVNINTLTDHNDIPIGTVGITRDIMERRKYQKELEMLLSAFKLTSDAIIVVDLDGRIIDVNRSFLKIFKVPSRESVIGIDGFSLLVQADPEDLKKRVQEIMTQGSVVENTYSVRDMEGNPLSVHTTATTLKDEFSRPRGFLITARDLSC